MSLMFFIRAVTTSLGWLTDIEDYMIVIILLYTMYTVLPFIGEGVLQPSMETPTTQPVEFYKSVILDWERVYLVLAYSEGHHVEEWTKDGDGWSPNTVQV